MTCALADDSLRNLLFLNPPHDIIQSGQKCTYKKAAESPSPDHSTALLICFYIDL